MSWTSPQDILDRWVGGSEPTDLDLIQQIINDAESVILAEYPRIDERITDGSLALSTVVMVVSRMAARVLRNPENLSYWQQQTGPFAQGRTYGEDRDIWLLEKEKQMLAPTSRGKAFEVNQGYAAVSPPQDFAWRDLTYPVWRRVGE
jgi:hypothetical protein